MTWRFFALAGLLMTSLSSQVLFAQQEDEEVGLDNAVEAPRTSSRPGSSPQSKGPNVAQLLEALSGKKIYQTWDYSRRRYGIGFFSGSSPNSILFEHWTTPKSGYELLVGFQKSEGAFSQSTNTTVNVTGSSSTLTEAYSGTRSPGTFVLGGAYNHEIFQSEWIRIRTAFHGHLRYQMETDYQVGSRVVTTPNTASPTDYTVTETGLGTTTVGSGLWYSLGPAIGADVFLRWFPNLSVGFYSLLLWNSERSFETTTSTRTRTYNVVAGVEQTPSSDSTSSVTTKSQPGSSGSTTALGGSTFSLMGNFTIRYVW